MLKITHSRDAVKNGRRSPVRGVDTAGKMLGTSGRIASEMAAKAGTLCINGNAFRTLPTDMALRTCAARGIALAGYVRGEHLPSIPITNGSAVPGDERSGHSPPPGLLDNLSCGCNL